MPSRFVHIRHYGWLANRVRRQKLPRCRLLLAKGSVQRQDSADGERGADNGAVAAENHSLRCPACREGRMVVVERFAPDPYRLGAGIPLPEENDTS